MHKAVFIKPALLDFAQKNLILIEVDYPRRKPLSAKVTEQNQRLMRQYQIEQLPTVVLLNPEGKILGRLEGYAGEGAEELVTWVEKLSPKSQ